MRSEGRVKMLFHLVVSFSDLLQEHKTRLILWSDAVIVLDEVWGVVAGLCRGAEPGGQDGASAEVR